MGGERRPGLAKCTKLVNAECGDVRIPVPAGMHQKKVNVTCAIVKTYATVVAAAGPCTYGPSRLRIDYKRQTIRLCLFYAHYFLR